MTFPENEYLAYRIVQFLVSQYYSQVYFDIYNIYLSNAIEWLDMCSGLEKVQIAPNKYDEGLLYCGNVWNYSVSKTELSSKLSTELVRFLFAWGALESLIKVMVSTKKIKKYGKINALCGYLKEHNLSNLLPAGYLNEYEHMIALLRESVGYEDVLFDLKMETQTRFSHKEYVDISGIGVYVVSKIRNDFVHGQMQFPEPEEYSGEQSSNVELIHTATRITLMTILTLLISEIKDNDFILEDAPDDGMEHSALLYLRNLCSYYSDTISGQLKVEDIVDIL